ncbi:MAG: D-alanyl-D-alanine carboxypeptidase family protein [Oscillospiraceae bacterium]|nr:D-alanyl-D-alanine carboxypeptidase family protein [Oscillospiraceae bacterium]
MSASNRKGKKKLRYDRVIAVGVLFIILIVLLVSCIGSCSDKNEESSVVISSQPVQTATEESSQTDNTEPASITTTEPVTENSDFTVQKLEYSEINKGDLVLVNKTYEYKFTEDLNIVDVYSNRNDYYTVKDMEVSLESSVINQLNAMMEAYYKANNNTDIRVIEAYRSKEEQDKQVSGNKTDVTGGYSDYNTARSFALGSFPKDGTSYYLLDEGVYSWIYDNMQNYGFILRYPVSKDLITGMPSSTYRFRYVGVPHAIYIAQNNLTLEEYIENIKSYNKDKPLKVTDGTKNYDIYYVPANVNNVTEVPVPSDKTYTISGNNIDGFIVTVTLN